jgi:hypothetical protein
MEKQHNVYESPAIEIIETVVESGFCQSGPDMNPEGGNL